MLVANIEIRPHLRKKVHCELWQHLMKLMDKNIVRLFRKIIGQGSWSLTFFLIFWSLFSSAIYVILIYSCHFFWQKLSNVTVPPTWAASSHLSLPLLVSFCVSPLLLKFLSPSLFLSEFKITKEGMRMIQLGSFLIQSVLTRDRVISYEDGFWGGRHRDSGLG